MTNITIREGTEIDQFAAFKVFRTSLFGVLMDLNIVDCLPTIEEINSRYKYYHEFLNHLYDTCDQYWLAESNDEVVGFARSIVRDGIRQLTEFFVLQEYQSQGVGRQLLEKAFPRGGAENRIICASPNTNALSLYLKTGLRSQTTIYEWSRKPEIVPFETDLIIRSIEDNLKNISTLNEIDRSIIGYTREIDHRWLIKHRHGHFYMRENKVVGYSYFDYRAGPIAMLHKSDFAAALANVESEMTKTVDEVYDEIILCIPMNNHAALDYVLGRGFKITPFFEHFLTKKPFGHFENYVFTDPIFIT